MTWRPSLPAFVLPGGRPTPSRADVLAMAVLVLLSLSLFGPHLAGQSTFIGNSDRLYTFLNVRLFETEQLRQHGTVPAWTDRHFMGAPLGGLHWMLPAFDPVAWLLALAPPGELIRLAGLVSALHVVLAALAAYLFIRDVVRAPFPSAVGAGLYVCSAFAVHRISQVDSAYAVLIAAPLGLWVLRRTGPGRAASGGIMMTGLVTLLVGFTFLQEAAYTLLAWGGYALYRSTLRRDLRPLAVLVVAGTAGLLLAAPRLGTVLEDLRELSRGATFATVCPCEALRWLNDGIYGRVPSEVRQLENNLNLHEGLQLYTSTFAVLLIVAVVGRSVPPAALCWRTRHRGPDATHGDPDLWFFGGWLLLVFAVVLSDEVRYGLYLAFFQIDFSHTRVVVTGLLPICLLAAAFLEQLLGQPTAATAGATESASLAARPWIAPTLGVAAALALMLLFAPLSAIIAGALFGPADRVVLATWLPAVLKPALGEVLAAGIVFAVLVGAHWLLGRAGSKPGRVIGLARVPAYALGGLLLLHTHGNAFFQLNGPHTRSYPTPFAGNNNLTTPVGVLRPPSASALAAMRERLEVDRFRSVIVSAPDGYPTYDTPSERGHTSHTAQFWRLRLVDGYTGLSRRLADLPWPESSHSLRSISFPRAEALPWPLLAVLNVKYAIVASPPLLFNVPGDVPGEDGAGRGEAAPADLQIVENPLPPAPRVFFARAIVPARPGPGSAPLTDVASVALTTLGRSAPPDTASCGVVEHARVEPPCDIAVRVGVVGEEGGQVVVSWRPLDDPRAVPIIDLYSALDERIGWPIAPPAGTGQHTLTGLDVTTTYRIRLRSCFNDTCSPSSPAVVVTVPGSLTAADLRDRIPFDPAAESRVEGITERLTFGDAGGQIGAAFVQDRLTLDLEPASTPRFLVVNELYHPGWRAFAGDTSLPVLPTNTVMRGLTVPPGVTHIEMQFVPFLRTWPALALMAAGALAAVIGALGLRRLDARSGTTPRVRAHAPTEALV